MTQNNERDALIDFNYFDKKLKSMIRDLQSYTPDELARELQRLSNTASPISQNEQQAVVGVVYDRYLAASEHGMYLNTFYSDKELELESKLYTPPPKQIPDGWITNALVEALNCDYQSTLDSDQVKIFNTGVATLYEIIKESRSKSLTSETNTEVVDA